jgi:galactonate dehydratase
MYVHSFYRAGPVMGSAIAGIDQALWDLRGKILGVPVYKLLGGPNDPAGVRGYYQAGGRDLEALRKLRDTAISQGITCFKGGIPGYYEWIETNDKIDAAIRGIQMLREGLGPDIDIGVDFHAKTSPSVASIIVKESEPLNLLFIEEPCPPENVKAMARISRRSTTPIATGERLVTRHQFRPLFEKQACHVIQPDLCHCGGLWEAKKIAAMAEVYTMGVAPHNPLGPVANAAALHFDLSTPNFLIQEDMLTDVPWRWEVVRHSLKTENGYWLPTEAPGLGIEVDEAAAAKHPFKQEVLQSTTIRAGDNAILDW